MTCTGGAMFTYLCSAVLPADETLVEAQVAKAHHTKPGYLSSEDTRAGTICVRALLRVAWVDPLRAGASADDAHVPSAVVWDGCCSPRAG